MVFLQSVSAVRTQTADRSRLAPISGIPCDAELAVGCDWEKMGLCTARAAALTMRETRTQSHKPKSPARGGRAQWQLRRATAYIEANLGRVIKLPELAEAARKSRGHFSRALGTSAFCSQKFTACRRIARAKTLMASTQDPLSRIADARGFYDQAHFCRAKLRREKSIS